MFAKRLFLILLVLMLVAFSIDASAAITVIVETSKKADIDSIAASLGGTVLDSMPGDSKYLLSLPSMPSTLPSGVTSMTLDTAVVLPRFRGSALSATGSGGMLPWYANRPAFNLVNAASARAKATGRGVIVADINSQVDVSHPALQGHLTTGHDFVGNSDPKTRTGATLQQSSASFLDQSSASFLESGSAGHGHGTMVAGILAALAPDALIMPLRAFDDSGAGDAFQVAKAIRYAVRNGAQVINLSLGFTSDPAEVAAAIDFAVANNVVVIAAAGNSNSSEPQYPAAFPSVIGVGSTDLQDAKASFSNYGQSVFVTAPGVNIFTAFPGGYAVGSGTSFSSAIAAAEVALIRSLATTGIYNTVAATAVDIDSIDPAYAGQLGYGLIDLLAAVSASGQTTSVTRQPPASRNFGRLIVRFKAGTGKPDRAAAAAQAGASVRFNYDIVESMAIEAPGAALQGLLHNP